jgi:membrane fusion protein (multidrug efflux system)
MLYEAEVARSKANKDYADIEFQNTKTLSDKKIVSEQELALSKAKLDKEKADLDLARTHLNLTTIRAPFSGIMDKFQARLGSLVDEGELLTTLSDNSTLWVYFNVPESEYLDYMSRIKGGASTEVRLRMANNELYHHPGTMGTIEADFNNETGNIAFRATFPNPDRLLRHGETGMVLVPNVFQKAIIIPQEATFDILDKKFVYVVDAKGKVSSREITIKAELPHLYIVDSGLQATEQILIDGLRKVKNGDEIKASFKPYATVLQELSHLHAE